MINTTDLAINISKEYSPNMNTDCKIYATPDLQNQILNDKNLITQLTNITKLPGVTKTVIGLPDLHGGYVLPIGSVTSFNLHDNPIILPGGVGYDINCGVRCIKTNLSLEEFDIQKALDTVDISPTEISLQDLNGVLDYGLEFLAKNKIIGWDNIEYTESGGKYEGCSRNVSQKSKGRGMHQFGSLGCGNHYMEIEYVEKIFDKEVCDVLGLKENQIVISVHSGSRGLGHSVCRDSLVKFNAEVTAFGIGGYLKVDESVSLNESVYLPADHHLSVDYTRGMSSACNFAFGNRAMISEKVIKCLKTLYPRLECELIYDTSHNIAKIENDLDSLIIRKGASRILEPYNSELPFKYREIGQPVLVGGSMGTSSYIICGNDCLKTYRSTCHGSGRVIQRKDSKKLFEHDKIIEDLKSRNIYVKSGSIKGIIEEAPGCYKNIDEVVECSRLNGITKTACRVKPILVIKDM
jgi:tRNA-splicing ligase RtcB (3'-phosphate/5'-hydroxy nucleic acid ligase)